jgi:hypothetical protein
MQFADLDLLPPRDDHRGDHRSGEQAVLDDPDRRREPGGQLFGVVELAQEVGDDATVGTERDITKPYIAKPVKRCAEPVLQQLERDRRRQPLHDLSEETITTKRSAAAATAFSRV